MATQGPAGAAALGHGLVRLLGSWAAPDRPLHASLTDRMRQLVRSGDLPAGVRLPSERILATQLGVSRNTVAAAFECLRAEGVLASRRGSGTYVSAAGLNVLARGDHRLGSFDGAAPVAAIDLRSAAPGGLPMVAEVVHDIQTSDLAELVRAPGYIPGGMPELRAEVSRYYSDVGLPTTPDQVLITSGAQQALQLVASCLLEPGAKVLVEEPTFRGAIEALRAVGARLLSVPSGPDGVDVAAVSAVLRAHRPALMLVQSSVHNPVGSVLPEAERAWLAGLAARYGVPVVDDAAPMDTLIDGTLPRPLAIHGGQVVTIGSASKAFWGGLRVGWIRADAAVIARLASVKGGSDLGTSLLAQVAAARLLGRIDEARDQRRRELAASRALLFDLLAQWLPEWSPIHPRGGASVFVRLPGGGATQLVQQAAREHVMIFAGPTFSSGDGLDDHVRIAYAASDADLREGVRRLAAVWHHR